MNGRLDRVIQYYNECAADYNLIWHTSQNLSIHMGFCEDSASGHDESLLKMNEVLAKKARVSMGDRVVDLGCGVGGSAIWLAQNVGCKVVGVDINERFLRMAQQEVHKRSLDKFVGLYRTDFCRTTFPAETFDVGWALESACYAEDKRAFLAEAARILKPGGRLVVADGFATEQRDELKAWLAGWAVLDLTSPTIFESYLVRHGFTNINYDNVTENVLPSSARLYRYAKLLYPLGLALERLGLRTKVQTANIVSAIRQHETLRKGLWQYGIFTAEKPG